VVQLPCRRMLVLFVPEIVDPSPPITRAPVTAACLDLRFLLIDVFSDQSLSCTALVDHGFMVVLSMSVQLALGAIRYCVPIPGEALKYLR
jgi:hypothetical protein